MLTLSQLFQDKLIPWAESGLQERLLVAQLALRRADVPPGFEINKSKISGKRVVIRNRRYTGYRLYYAEWPEDHLHELTAPKLVCVVKGVTDYLAGPHLITCGEGHFILLPALVPNIADGRPNLEGERRHNGYCELLQILVARDTIHCMFSTQSGPVVQDVIELSCMIHHQQAARLFNDFMEQAQAGEEQNLALQQHLLAAFLWIVCDEINAGRAVYTIAQNPQAAPPERTAGELQDYLKAHLRHAPTIEKAARHFYMSPRQFTRHLRRETGQSFVETLTACRLAEAKRLLAETRWTIAGIAYLVGFKSAAYFNAFFKRHVGCSPGAYRRQTAGKENLPEKA